MRLTKKRRLEAYKFAYNGIMSELDNGNDEGYGYICGYLSEKIPKGYIWQSYLTMVYDFFPEFELFEPGGYYCRTWFNTEKERLIALMFCIAMLEE